MMSKLHFRIMTIILILILLLPVWPLVSHSSSAPGALWGRYTLRYLLVLVAYAGVLIGLGLLAVTAQPIWIAALQKILKPIQRFWFLIVILALVSFQSWYWVRDLLIRTAFFGVIRSPTYQLMLLFTGLLIVYMIGVLVFAGRAPDDLKMVVFRMVTLAFGLGLAFVVFSLGYAWVLHGDSYRQTHTVWSATRNDRLLGTLTRPNLTDYQMYLPDEHRMVSISTNVEGFRGPGPEVERPIAVIGDSYTFGLFSDDEYLWTNTLSDLLDVPVANYSMWGIELDRYVRIAENYIEPGEHDLVIYVIFANDVSPRTPPNAPRNFSRLQASRRVALSPITYTYSQLFVRQSPFELLLSSLNETEIAEPTEHGYLEPCAPPGMTQSYTREMRGLVEDYVDVVLELAQEGDYQVAFVLIPSNVAVYPDELVARCGQTFAQYIAFEASAYADLCSYAEASGVICYDTTEAFREAADRPEPLFLSVDTHWNRLGNEVFAGIMADLIREIGVVP